MLNHPQMSIQSNHHESTQSHEKTKAQNINHLKDIMGNTSQITTCRVDQEWGMRMLLQDNQVTMTLSKNNLLYRSMLNSRPTKV